MNSVTVLRDVPDDDDLPPDAEVCHVTVVVVVGAAAADDDDWCADDPDVSLCSPQSSSLAPNCSEASDEPAVARRL